MAELVLAAPAARRKQYTEPVYAPVGISNRHIHLSPEDLAVLFGQGYQLVPAKELSQPGEFAGREVVALVGPKGVIEGVRVVGPVRKESQVEISVTDSYRLGVRPPVRLSGELDGTPGITVIGPKGLLHLSRGLIIAARHLHLPSSLAEEWGLEHGAVISAQVEGPRGVIFGEVAVRVSSRYRLELHLDTDEANGALLKTGDPVRLLL
ncbi:MAG TPA: phosphate propanoyltransferase [Clostridia bacterium]|nr:phosphate propanoyltransferase [Clostridia bacterium]